MQILTENISVKKFLTIFKKFSSNMSYQMYIFFIKMQISLLLKLREK